jgi:hypothetical protein
LHLPELESLLDAYSGQKWGVAVVAELGDSSSVPDLVDHIVSRATMSLDELCAMSLQVERESGGLEDFSWYRDKLAKTSEGKALVKPRVDVRKVSGAVRKSGVVPEATLRLCAAGGAPGRLKSFQVGDYDDLCAFVEGSMHRWPLEETTIPSYE